MYINTTIRAHTKYSLATIALAVLCMLGVMMPGVARAAGPLPVDLATAADFAILSKSGITNVPTSIITGNVGVSPSSGTTIGVTCAEVSGTVYSVDGSGPLPCRVTNSGLLTTAVGHMEAAYTDAAGRAGPDGTDLYAGIIGGHTFTPGLYKWTSNVTIPTNVTLSGGPDDVWIFQVAGNLTISSATNVVLTGGAKASNVFWQVGGVTGATIGTTAIFNGNILSATQIIIQTNAVLNGRALAQTQVTLDQSTVSIPTTLHVVKVVSGGSAIPSNFNVHVRNALTVEQGGGPFAGVAAPGTSYLLSAGTYTVSEDVNTSYTRTFSGACNASGVVTLSAGNDVTCTITNTFNGSGGGGGASFNAPLPLINVTKIPSPLALPAGPGPVTYTYIATNIGPVAMYGVWVRDNLCEVVAYVSGDSNADSILDINEAWTYRCTKVVSQTETNTATAHGQANGWDAYDTASATVAVGVSLPPPLIHLVKRPNIFLLPAGGGAVTYMYAVTNPGVVPLSDVSVIDDKCTGLPGRVVGHPGDINQNNLLESNETWSFTCQTNLTQTTTNIGTAQGRANGLTAIDFSPATVAVAAPGFPDTGYLSEWQSMLLSIVTLGGILVVLLAAFVVLKRQSK